MIFKKANKKDATGQELAGRDRTKTHYLTLTLGHPEVWAPIEPLFSVPNLRHATGFEVTHH